MNIGKAVKTLRLKKGMTQQELADELNVSSQTISRWETSATYPDITLLPQLARCFHVSIDELLSDGEDKMMIKSQHLLVREWRERDAEALFELKQTSGEYFLAYVDSHTAVGILELIKIWKSYQEMFAVVLKETGKLIGVVGLVDVGRYKAYRELEVHLCDEYYQDELLTELCELILDYGFGRLDLQVIFALCAPSELVLQHVLENVGFLYEGTLRRFGRDGSDRQRYSMIQADYSAK